jgi:hypothetical protein
LDKVTPLARAWAGRVSSWADVAASAQRRFRDRWWQSTEHHGGTSGFRRGSWRRALVHSSNGGVVITARRASLSCREVRGLISRPSSPRDGPMACTIQAVTSLVTDDPVVGGRFGENPLRLFSCSPWQDTLASAKIKCQRHRLPGTSQWLVSSHRQHVLIAETHVKGSDPSG